MEKGMKKLPENLNGTISWNLIFRNFVFVSYKVCAAPQSGSVADLQLYLYLCQLGLPHASGHC